MHYDSLRIGRDRRKTARTAPVMNPYTGSVAGTVPMASLEDVRAAIAVARAYKPTLTRFERSQVCLRTAALLRERTEMISNLITAESGLSKKDSIYEVGRACDVFTFAGNAALIDDGQIFSCDLTPHGKKRRVYTMREPLLGVISAITPFNHPLNQVAHKVAPSIATNNRMVLMNIKAENSSAEVAATDVGVIFNRQRAESQVLVADGEAAGGAVAGGDCA